MKKFFHTYSLQINIGALFAFAMLLSLRGDGIFPLPIDINVKLLSVILATFR